MSEVRDSQHEAGAPDTFLPHWGPVRRLVHSACRRSRRFNTLVAALEMRLSREELLSLPQYMGLCPTGQCNAQCGFCSVTINRTGIIKKQIPLEKLRAMIAPMARTIRLYGIEGNGEPTLHDQFEELVDELTVGGAKFYLITNAANLSEEQIYHLVERGIDSVNVSLNAATPETHRVVMKLRRWDEAVRNVRRFVAVPGKTKRMVSASFVVTHDNIHEVTAFLELADHELKVHRIHLRPLSEIATDAGPVEDVRGLVPYESDVRDCVERVQDWTALNTPKTKGYATLCFAPETFRAFRSDPVDRIVKPPGFEDRLLAPRPRDWRTEHAQLRCRWSLDGLALALPRAAGSGLLLRSAPVSTDSSRSESLRVRVRVKKGALELSLRAPGGEALAARVARASSAWQSLEIPVDPAWGLQLEVGIGAVARGLVAEIDFERLRRPCAVLGRAFELPPARRWEIGATTRVQWSASCVRLAYEGPSGPYLLKSFSVPCRRQAEIELAVAVDVQQGGLGIGVLDQSAGHWIHTSRFSLGRSEAPVVFKTGDNERVYCVLYSTQPGRLQAQVDFGSQLHVEVAAQAPGQPLEAQPVPAPEAVPPVDPRSALRRWLRPRTRIAQFRNTRRNRRLARRLARRREPRIYCQKPWTDLQNLTVDGRIDVCCIATGASQERYKLGNIFEDSFQDVWNGPVAREFRRTVNTPGRLPPCQRCPMAYAYQGPLFDPVDTYCTAGNLFFSWIPWWRVRVPLQRMVLRLYDPLHWLLFKDFKQRP